MTATVIDCYGNKDKVKSLEGLYGYHEICRNTIRTFAGIVEMPLSG